MTKKKDQLNDLILSIANKEKDSFDYLYKLTYEKLYQIAIKTLIEPKLAEEALKDTFIEIYQNAADFDTKDNAMVWVSSIARNKAIDKLRKTRKLSDYDVITYVKEQLNLSTEYGVNKYRHIKDCIEKIDHSEKDIILLAYMHGYTQTQIASQLDISLDAIKSLSQAGLDSLKDCIQERITDTKQQGSFYE